MGGGMRRRKPTPEDATKIIQYFLDGHGVTHICYLMDYDIVVDDVNSVIREELRSYLFSLAKRQK
jgi:hypothetical protein